MDAKELAQRMAEDAPLIAQHLLPDGKRQSGEWKCGSLSGEPGKSLSVRLAGVKAGVWADFATGEGGDLLDLWAQCRGLSISETMREVKAFLNIRDDRPLQEVKKFKRPQRPECTTPKSEVESWFESRWINKETLKAFQIAEKLQHGKTYALFPYKRDGELINIKYRNIKEKKDMRQEGGAEPCLFGWHLIDPKARQITICEGEMDCLSLHQMGIPALSVNAGAGNHQWIENDWDNLARFSDIVICFDSDEAGQKGAREVAHRLGNDRCRIAQLPEKDANECLMKGYCGEDLLHYINDARPLDPEELRQASDFMQRVKAMFYPAPEDEQDPHLMLDNRIDWFAFRPGELTVWTGFNGHGKALCIDTPIPTPNGFKRMGDIHPGDVVFGENGKPCNVVAETAVMHGRPCYRVTFNDGTEIIADAQHEWLTWTARVRTSWRTARRNNRLTDRPLAKRGNDQSHKRAMPSIITTEGIAETLLVTDKSYYGTRNHSIPVAGALELPKQNLLIDPYLLGAWLGDGNSYGACITTPDMEILDEFSKHGVTVTEHASKYRYGLTGGFVSKLREEGLIRNKHIPEKYMLASKEQRLALLQGLMDTDGHITDYGRCEFCNVNERLANQVFALVQSLGIQCKIITGDAILNGRVIGKKYRVTFTPHIPVFRIKRKAKYVKSEVSQRIRHRFIVGCEKIESVPVKCIQVDSESHLYLASEALIPTHNSLILSQALLGLIKQGERAVVFSGEMTPERQLKRIVKQCSGLDRPSMAYMDSIANWLHNKLWIFNVVGSAGIDRLLDVFLYACRRYGARHFVIDSLMMTDVPEDGHGSMTAQKEAMRKLCDFVKRHGCHIHLVAHPRKGVDESKGPGKMDVAGSSKITDAADNVFTVWNARKDESKDPDPDAIDGKLELQKQRNGDVQHRTLPFWFNKDAQQFCTSSLRMPIRYVEFSEEERSF